jgi:hypothetical protein
MTEPIKPLTRQKRKEIKRFCYNLLRSRAAKSVKEAVYGAMTEFSVCEATVRHSLGAINPKILNRTAKAQRTAHKQGSDTAKISLNL